MSAVRSGFCQFAVHTRCAGTAAGDTCGCTCHQPVDQRPAARLHRAADALRAEACRAIALLDTYVDEQPPLLALADQILETTP